MLKKCVGYPKSTVPLEVWELRTFLWITSHWNFGSKSQEVEKQGRFFCGVFWMNQLVAGATWEATTDMMSIIISFFQLLFYLSIDLVGYTLREISSLTRNLPRFKWVPLRHTLAAWRRDSALTHQLSQAEWVGMRIGFTLSSWASCLDTPSVYQFSSISFTTSLSLKTKTHIWDHICNYNLIRFIHNY